VGPVIADDRAFFICAHELYDEARSRTPVMRQPGSKTERPFWALLRYANIDARRERRRECHFDEGLLGQHGQSRFLRSGDRPRPEPLHAGDGRAGARLNTANWSAPLSRRQASQRACTDEDKVIQWTDAVFSADDPKRFKGPEEASRTCLTRDAQRSGQRQATASGAYAPPDSLPGD
jgi:hypothetical protein